MKFSIGVPGLNRYAPLFDPWMAQIAAPDFQRICRRYETIGFDAVESAEHLALDATLAADMGGFWPHALAAIAFFAGATERIAVNTSILVLPFHHPVNLAKAISTLDVLTGGRVMLSVGLGHGEAEFRALGVPYAERGRIADEYLEAMQVLWTKDYPTFAGRFASFEGIVFEPKPLQKPFPPLWIGGDTKAALRRALRFGTGWRPWQAGLEELPAWLEVMAQMPEAQDRREPFDLHIPAVRLGVGEDHRPRDGEGDGRAAELGANELVDRLGRMAELGVTWTSLPQVRATSMEGYLDAVEARYGPVLAQCHGASA
ncbi:MAG: putative F420-dependent oxidoreductase, Rv2161c family [Phenylobacterium sp.]|nr:putative F420-dependent oxidoreductase, Rv2161c family [Phenylobacterium sp.]